MMEIVLEMHVSSVAHQAWWATEEHASPIQFSIDLRYHLLNCYRVKETSKMQSLRLSKLTALTPPIATVYFESQSAIWRYKTSEKLNIIPNSG
jgi:hypothetical protein